MMMITPKEWEVNQLTVHSSSGYRMLFSQDRIPTPFHKIVQQEDKMVNPLGQDVILDRGNIKHTLKGAGISDSLVTEEQYGGLSDRAEEWNFIFLHVNMLTTMGMLGAITLFLACCCTVQAENVGIVSGGQ